MEMTDKKDEDGNYHPKKMSEEKFVEKIRKHADSEVDKVIKDEFMNRAIDLGARIMSRLSKMSPTMRAHYYGEVLAISRDLAKDLKFKPEREEDLALLISMLLQYPNDDDDDDDGEKPDLPKTGDLVPA